MVWQHYYSTGLKTSTKLHLPKTREFPWFSGIPATNYQRPKQDGVASNHVNSYGFAALLLTQAEKTIKLQRTKARLHQEVGCISQIPENSDAPAKNGLGATGEINRAA